MNYNILYYKEFIVNIHLFEKLLPSYFVKKCVTPKKEINFEFMNVHFSTKPIIINMTYFFFFISFFRSIFRNFVLFSKAKHSIEGFFLEKGNIIGVSTLIRTQLLIYNLFELFNFLLYVDFIYFEIDDSKDVFSLNWSILDFSILDEISIDVDDWMNFFSLKSFSSNISFVSNCSDLTFYIFLSHFINFDAFSFER